MLDWIYALATIAIMKEPAITGGLTATEQILMWKHRVNSLRRVPWIFAPITLTATDKGATWADVTAAKLVVGATGQLTLSIGDGDRYVELKAPTTFYGILRSTNSAVRPWYWGSRSMACMMRLKSPSPRLCRTESPTLLPELLGSAPAGVPGGGRGEDDASSPASMRDGLGDALQKDVLHALVRARVTTKTFLPVPASGIRNTHATLGFKVMAVVEELFGFLEIWGMSLLEEVDRAIVPALVPAWLRVASKVLAK